MIPLPLSSLVEACGAYPSDDAQLGRRIELVSTDTRRLAPGCLYVALVGERFDGHDFLADAARGGAAAAVVSRPVPGAPLPLLEVRDTLKALGDLGMLVRNRSGVPLAAITGSVGKTTTKEMTALALSSRFRTLKSEANENNEIGVPSTLLRLDTEHEAAVVEMGMRAPGEIRYLSGVARPDAAVITVIGDAHIGRLGSRDAIARAKAEILEGLRPNGVAVLNRDDAYFDQLKRQAPAALSFGLGAADVRAEEVLDRGLDGSRFRVNTPWGAARVSLQQGGIHLVQDALAALAAALHLGAPLDGAAAALARFQAGAGRGRRFRAARDLTVIDDSYNASPDSVEAALSRLVGTPDCQRPGAALGDMLEMGDSSEDGHRRVGRAAAAAGLHRLVCVGPLSQCMADAATRAGLPASAVQHYPDSASAARDVSSWSAGLDFLLVKGSNGTRMNVIVRALEEMGPAPSEQRTAAAAGSRE